MSAVKTLSAGSIFKFHREHHRYDVTGLCILFFIFSVFFILPSKSMPSKKIKSESFSSEKSSSKKDSSESGNKHKNGGQMTKNNGGQLVIHYHRNEGDYKKWQLWVWGLDSSEGKAVIPAVQDSFGLVFSIDPGVFRTGEKIGILPRKGEWEDKDGPERILDPKILKNGTKEIFIVQNLKDVFITKPDTSPQLVKAFLDSEKNMRAVFSRKVALKDLSAADFSIQVFDPASNTGPVFKVTAIDNSLKKVKKAQVIQLSTNISWPENKRKKNKDRLLQTLVNKTPVMVLRTEKFGSIQIMPGDLMKDLRPEENDCMGMVLKKETAEKPKLLFSAFSPFSTKLALNILKDNTRQKIELVKKSNGVWHGSIDSSLLPFYYNIGVTALSYDVHKNKIVSRTSECMDPYVQCTAFHSGSRGTMGLAHMDILDYSNTPDDSSAPDDIKASADQCSIIYEMHVRDFIIQDKKGGTYKALTQSPRLEHIKKLGFTHVQIMPVQDFDHAFDSDEYNWGYMPVFFNSPEEWYADSKAPEDLNSPARVHELKDMIKKIHDLGLKAVLDVVYNHSAESPVTPYGFEILAPGYYYRLNRDGSLSNGSGCGNEFASEMPFARKFLVDSLKYWVQAYDMDGFRFDLMGLIDIASLKTALAELKKIKPDIIVYGEPWAAGPTPIKPTVKGTQRGLGFSVFNDVFRDSIRGSVWDRQKGYVSSKGAGPAKDIKNLKKAMKGSLAIFTDNPDESINYAACHDNRTLYDRFLWTLEPEDHKLAPKMVKMANMILFLSQGIPLMHSGQEMLRTKDLEHNSYNLSDSINMIDWKLDDTEKEIVEFTAGLIKIRKQHPCFRMTSADMVKKRVKFLDPEKRGENIHSCIICRIDSREKKNIPLTYNDSWSQALIILNPYDSISRIRIPKGKWKASVLNSSINNSEKERIFSGEFDAAPVSGTLLYME